MYNPQGPPYGRYHDPNMPPMDMYNRYHPGGIEMKMPPNRPPPQRYPVSIRFKFVFFLSETSNGSHCYML